MSDDLQGQIQKIFSKFITDKNELDAVSRGEAILVAVSIDSLAMVHMIMEFEKEFGIRFDPDTLEQIFENQSTLLTYIASNIKNKT